MAAADEHQSPSPDADIISITLTYAGEPHVFNFPLASDISDLASHIETTLSIPLANQKLLIPKLGLLRHPFQDPLLPLAELQGKKIVLMGSTAETVSSLQAAASLASARHASRTQAVARRPKPNPSRPANPADAQYTFMTIRPLEGLSHPERSLTMLQRLAVDPGIRAVMRTHKFAVGLLTEMEPLSNTSSTHEGTTRLLGLNRNQGEVIELRLRTDAHDGYRDYATVRRTLCHELAHNVHGPHDAKFWDLCKRIERQVETASTGRTVGEDARWYAPSSEDMEEDTDGWTGGEFVLGASSGAAAAAHGLSRREVLARAAEERKNRAKEAEEQPGASAS